MHSKLLCLIYEEKRINILISFSIYIEVISKQLHYKQGKTKKTKEVNDSIFNIGYKY